MSAFFRRGRDGEPYLQIDAGSPLRTLHSSIWNGGYGAAKTLINRQVNKRYSCEDPVQEMERFLRQEGVEADGCCAMLTAALVEGAGFASLRWRDCREAESGQSGAGNGAAEGGRTGETYDPDDELAVCAWVTAGLGNAARAGAQQPLERIYPGTINIILLIDGRLSDAAMVGAVLTATEAKAAVLQEMGIRAAAGGPEDKPGGDETNAEPPIATGTTTDAVLLAATDRDGRTYEYAGTATRLGYLVGRSVAEALRTAVKRYLDYRREHPAN